MTNASTYTLTTQRKAAQLILAQTRKPRVSLVPRTTRCWILSSSTVERLARVATLADETVGWPYRHNHDLTGFIDGSENPPVMDASSVAVIPEGRPGAGGSVLLLQKWIHETAKWTALSDEAQSKIIGRTKADSIELDD